jgi:hypothetical protein
VSSSSSSSAAVPTAASRLIYCRCAFAQVVPQDVKDAVLDGLNASGRGFEAVADLCDMAARRDPQLAALTGGQCGLQIVACWPRAVEGLFAVAETPLPSDTEILNMRAEQADTILARLHAGPTPEGSP